MVKHTDVTILRWVPLKSLEKNLSWPLLSFGCSLQPLAFLSSQLHHFTLCLCHYTAFFHSRGKFKISSSLTESSEWNIVMANVCLLRGFLTPQLSRPLWSEFINSLIWVQSWKTSVYPKVCTERICLRESVLTKWSKVSFLFVCSMTAKGLDCWNLVC